jgi:hypothetical protein
MLENNLEGIGSSEEESRENRSQLPVAVSRVLGFQSTKENTTGRGRR